MNNHNPVRVRFAPSPTGYLHIGGARTALFNWLWARQTGGSFILRVEDTDEERSTPESTRAIIEGMAWLGLDWDEGPDPDLSRFGASIGPYGPYYQSQRAARHKEVLSDMLARGEAFYCPASAEEMTEVDSEGRERKKLFSPYRELSLPEQQDALERAQGALPVRIKCPRGLELRFNDIVRGEVVVNSDELGDFIVQKSTGQLLYNFAVTCDDEDMHVTHVLRGEDHLSNTPKQLLIYRAMGWEPPVFGHVPLIVGHDRAKLSKRHGSTAVDNYKENGTLPEALVNFLALIGWAPKDNRENFTLRELVDVFNPADIGKSAGMFNAEKLSYFNGLYIRGLDPQEFYERVRPFCPSHWDDLRGGAYVERVCALYQDKLTRLDEIERNAWYFFTPPEELPAGREYSADETGYYNPKSTAKFITGNEQAPLVLGGLYARLSELGDDAWNSARLEALVDEFCAANGELGKGKVMQPWRVVLTGDQVSPGFFDLIVVLGREETLARAKPWVEKIG